MSSWGWVLIGIGVVGLCALIVWRAVAARRRRGLQESFGPEYDRTVADAPTRREAESDLAERQKRREQREIKPLEPAARDHYADEWHRAQEHFVDDPAEAVEQADLLIQEVMRARGYPVEDFDQRAADVSVDHPEVSRTIGPPTGSRPRTCAARPRPRICGRQWSTTARCSPSCSRCSPPRPAASDAAAEEGSSGASPRTHARRDDRGPARRR